MPLFRRAWPLVLAAALSVRAAAGVVTPAYAPVYAPPSGAWGAPLGAGLADASVMPLLPAGLNVPSLTTPEGLRAAAPLVQSLQKALSISPQAFAKMKPADKASAIELAVEDAREQARIKVYELVEEARVAASRPMDKEGRAALYAATARLMEVRTFYGPWLEEDASAAIEQSYTATSARAWEVRTSLLDSDLPDAAPAAKPKADAAPKKAYVLDPSSYALKLREDMKNNKSGWGQDDLHAIYTGFGFELRQGGKHRFYSHPAFPQLHDSVSRQNDLPPGYASSALKNIAELERLVAEQGKTAAAPATGPRAR
ncbi:MAG: hypothetical protein M0D55_06230 [Elusimicrobiota bacterium]|nr:MAG: hypothetical protein M0D55_06230 [Elusimicrobiota bacterium]